MNISVIIPMYGVENYIVRCARSLFEQTFTNGVEFLFIDDASKDKSREILQNIIDELAKNIDRYKNIIILPLAIVILQFQNHRQDK